MTDPTLPMSPAQQGMYFDSQLRQSADYHIAIELYTEPLSRSRLTQAVSAVVAEQPALRASVARNESGPVYMIAEWDTANPPGHGPSPVPPLTDLASLRTHYLDALRDILKPDAVFCGHSMGSVVAYHLLACMHRLPAFADRMPSDLVLSGSCAPHHLPMAGKADLADTDLVLHLASFGAIPDEVVKDKSLMDLFVPAFRADYKVLEEMRTTPTENLPIRARLVFGGRDPQIPEDTPAAWQKYFASPVKTHVLEREEHMFVLHTTEALNQILNRI